MKLFIFVAALCIAQAVARPEAPVEDTKPEFSLTDLLTKSQAFFDDVSQKAAEAFGTSNKEELAKKVKSDFETFTSNAEGLANRLGDEIKEGAGKADSLLGDTAKKIQERIAEIKEKNPEIVESAEKVRTTVTTQFSSILEELKTLGQKLKEDGVADKAEETFKSLVQGTADFAKSLSGKIDEAVKKE